jgi:hypothetical protein
MFNMTTFSETDDCSLINRSLLRKKDIVISISLGILVLLLGSQLIVKGVTGISHDDGIYIITAKAIAQGEGYRQIHLPDSPIQTKYPFLYPLFLAIIWKISPSFPGNLLWMQWMTLTMGAITVAASYLFFIRFAYFNRVISVAAVLLCATSPFFLFFCTTCRSEIPFALFLIVSMWVLERHLEKPFASRTAQLFAGVLLAFPFLCRTIGIMFLLGALIIALRHRKAMRFPILGIALIVLPFGLWMLWFSKWGSATSSNTYYTNYFSWWLSYGIPHLGRILASNAFDICFDTTPISHVVWVYVPKWVLYGSAAIGFLGLACFLSRISRFRVLPIFVAVYLMLVLVWPWPPSRFLIPIIPILFACAIAGVLLSLARFGCKIKFLNRIVLIPLGALLVANAVAINQDIATTTTTGYPARLFPYGEALVNWSSYGEMFEWIRENTGPNDVFASGMDPIIYLYTGRLAFRPFVARPSSMFYNDQAPAFGSLSDVMANVKWYKPRYLALFPVPGFADARPYIEFVVDSQKEYPGWLEYAYMGKDKRFIIWKVNIERLYSPIRTAPPN